MRSLYNQVDKTAILIRKSFRDQKITPENLDRDMYEAATFYVENYDPELRSSEFLRSLQLQLRRGWPLTWKQAAGALNWWRTDLLRAYEIVEKARDLAAKEVNYQRSSEGSHRAAR